MLSVTTHTGHLLGQPPEVLGTFLPGHFVDEDTAPESELHGKIGFVRANHYKCVLNAWMRGQFT